MNIKRLELYTTNVSQMVGFYRNVLGCAVMEEENACTINAGTTTLQFKQGNAEAYIYHFAFTIPYHQVEDALRWAAARVPLLELAPNQFLADFSNWNAKAFYFRDPSGNIVEFIGREPLEIVSNQPFSGTSLASVSEIGMVTDNVALASRQISELFNVPIFSRQPPAPQFSALGDDEGLFIVVQEGRAWYPTQTPAHKAPATVVFQTKDGLLRRLEME